MSHLHPHDLSERAFDRQRRAIRRISCVADQVPVPRAVKCGGRKSYAKARPEMVELARQLRRPDPDRRPVSLRKVAAALAERGYVASTGRPYEAAAVASMVGE